MKKIIFTCLISLLLLSCNFIKYKKQEKQSNINKHFNYSEFELKTGDILFQDIDCGPFCEAIEKVTEGIYGSKFSHVGMVIPQENGKLIVIEAVSEGVKLTPLDSFFNRSFDKEKNSKVVVGRVKQEYNHLITKAIEFSQTKLGLAYDEEFNILNNKYYCSELIYDSFKYANDNEPIFQLQKMTYKDPETDSLFPIWKDYFEKLNIAVPEGELGLNPGGMSMSEYIDIVHFYGKPQGYVEKNVRY